jgi:Domain of unknown function (DUF4333)
MTSPAIPAAAEGPAGRRRRGYWIPGLIAIAVLVAIGVAFGAGDLAHRGPNTLAGPELAQTLGQAIQAADGTASPPSVHCPDSEPARAGLQFVCMVTQGRAIRQVHVTEINGRGGLSWRMAS